MAQRWNLDRLAAEWEARGLDRRELLRLVAGGSAMTAIITLMGTKPLDAAAAPAVQEGEGQINVLWRQPVTLNPLYSTSGSEQQVERLMFGALVKMSGDLVPTPDLAESIDVSDDVTVYTFNLHQDITFNDGEPLTAEDVVSHWRRPCGRRPLRFGGGACSASPGPRSSAMARPIPSAASPRRTTTRSRSRWPRPTRPSCRSSATSPASASCRSTSWATWRPTRCRRTPSPWSRRSPPAPTSSSGSRPTSSWSWRRTPTISAAPPRSGRSSCGS